MIDTRDEKICVIIPCYKVEPYILSVICGMPEWIWRIIVVDDASPDQTAQIVREANLDRVILVRNFENRGVGGAMIAGYQKAIELGATILVKMDGDGQMSPAGLIDIVRPIIEGRADYAKGNRFAHVDEILKMPLVRRFGNISLSFLTKMASGYWNLFDPTNGYTALDADVFSRINQSRIHSRYFFESSMLIELNSLRAVIVDVPLPAQYAGEISSISILKVIREFPSLLFQGFTRRIWLQYFVLDFSIGSIFGILGILLILFGVVWGGAAWIKSIMTDIPATTGTVMLAVLPFILGFQLLLQTIVYDIEMIPRDPISNNIHTRMSAAGRSQGRVKLTSRPVNRRDKRSMRIRE